MASNQTVRRQHESVGSRIVTLLLRLISGGSDPSDRVSGAVCGLHLPARQQCAEMVHYVGRHCVGRRRRRRRSSGYSTGWWRCCRTRGRRGLQPFVFVGPALAILAWYLAIPVGRTFWISLFDRDGPQFGEFVGLANYVDHFHRPAHARGVSQQHIPVDSVWRAADGWLRSDHCDAGGSQQVRAHFQGADLPAHGDLVCGRRRDLEVHLCGASRGCASDRVAERHCRRIWAVRRGPGRHTQPSARGTICSW